jgi:hypothetical protein
MKKISSLVAVAVVFTALAAFAADISGTYTFSSRIKEGKPDLVGWNGTMTIGNGTILRKYASADGKDSKFYEGTFIQDKDIYTIKFTKAYKPEYVGQEHKDKITLNDKTLTMESTDGKFKEVWTKK